MSGRHSSSRSMERAMWGGMEASYQELHEGATLEASPLAQSALHMTATATAAKSLQSSLTLCDSIDGSPPGSAVPEILQARVLEWVAIAFSSRDWELEQIGKCCSKATHFHL